MIIGIDISSLSYGTGVSNYTINLVRQLIKIDHKNTYKLLFYSLRKELPEEIKSLKLKSNVKIYHYRFPPSFFEFIWNKAHVFPLEIFIGRCDVFHTWDWIQPPTFKAKTITTVHDLVPVLYPNYQHPKTIENFNLKMKHSVKECYRFICVSENTKKDLLSFYSSINPKKITIIFEAAEEKYDHFYKLTSKEKERKIEAIRHQYGLNRYILAQGTREPRKNLNRLIEAFRLYKKRNPSSTTELAIAGKYGWGEDVDHLKAPFIKILGFIPEKDMSALHAAALCLVYPSLYEGFGLPILKSMKVGVPVITSNCSSLPEVAGKSAILVNPESTEEISSSIEKITKDSNLRKRLSEKGLVQAKKFSWAKTAKDTLKLYEEVFQEQ